MSVKQNEEEDVFGALGVLGTHNENELENEGGEEEEMETRLLRLLDSVPTVAVKGLP